MNGFPSLYFCAVPITQHVFIFSLVGFKNSIITLFKKKISLNISIKRKIELVKWHSCRLNLSLKDAVRVNKINDVWFSLPVFCFFAQQSPDRLLYLFFRHHHKQSS